MKAISLFSSAGIAELLISDTDINVTTAVELKKERADFYSHIFPKTNVIIGDISLDYTKEKIINISNSDKLDLLIATPPCQGMSTAGKGDWKDTRNSLIKHILDIIKKTNFKYCIIENVPSFFNTKININNVIITIGNFIKNELHNTYHIDMQVVNSVNYGVAQNRKRAITLLTRKDQEKESIFLGNSKIKTVKDVIFDLPNMEAVSQKRTKNIIENINQPPYHNARHIQIMKNTPSGKSAFDNQPKFQPRKACGKLIKGFASTYKRMDWDKPAPTITMMNGAISSQNNVHPGNLNKKTGEYDNARVLTIHELMRIMSIPDSWNLPKNISEQFIRKIIGEGVPPLMMKQILEKIGGQDGR